MKQLARKMGPGQLLALALLALAASPLQAGVIVTGQLTIVSPPPSVKKGADTSLTTAIIFEERSGFALPTNISVDVTAPGTANSSIGYSPSPGTIAQGTKADIWFFHSDPTNSTLTTYTGTATFDTPVLGIIDTDAKLDATDSNLGHPGTRYPTALAARGLEDPDTLTLSADRRTISFSFTTSTAVDEIRVLVAVPEPSTLVTSGLCAGVFLAWGARRRLRRASAPVAV